MKPLLVGEALSNMGDGRPFSGPSGERFEQLLGRPLLSVLDVDNLFDLKPYRWVPREARKAAREVLKRHPDSERVVMAGNKVTKAFLPYHYKDLTYYTWLRVGDGGGSRLYVKVPHPSGRNRYWNYPLNSERCRKFLLTLMPVEDDRYS